MTDTAEDVLEQEQGEQTTVTAEDYSDEERRLISSLREKGLSAAEVAARIDKAAAASAKPAAPETAGNDADRPMTVGQFRKAVQNIQQDNSTAAATREIQATIGGVISESGLLGDDKVRRNMVVTQVLDKLRGREDIARMDEVDFKKVIVDTAKQTLKAEKEYVLKTADELQGKETAGRKTGAEAMGQRAENEPPPRSEAQTERPQGDGNTMGARDLKFGLDTKWPTDAQVQRDSSEQAQKFLKKARGD